MPSSMFTFLAEQYQSHHDPILHSHFEARSCLQLEDVLSVGVVLFDRLRRYLEQSPGDEQLVLALRGWARATRRWLVLGGRFEQGGYEVENLNELRRCYEEIRHVSLDAQGLAEAIKRLEEGGGVSVDEFFDGLQNPH
ncbi:MAG: hypothetical protein FJ276_28315 [Planctomycetes bacterium]|nr:hypothetical protein [Planctomycetota bacterium]